MNHIEKRFFKTVNLLTLNFKSYREVSTLLRELPALVFKSQPMRVKSVIETRLKLRDHECYNAVIDHLTDACFTFEVSINKYKYTLKSKSLKKNSLFSLE